MTIYNTKVSVVDLIDADSPEHAVRVLEARLTQAGFDVYDNYDTPASSDAFESEPLDDEEGLIA